jgi:Ca-activated chloride channel family protein
VVATLARIDPMLRSCVIPIIAVLAGVPAQEPAPLQPSESQTPVFSSRAELVVVHVTVRDRAGAYVTALPQEAFRIAEDGVRQQIDFFTGEDSPVTVGFLVDSSGSMRVGRERVIAAAAAFAQASRSDDELFALTFNEHVRPALPPDRPFTNDARTFRLALARAMGAHGLTAMYDAIVNGLSYIAKGHHPRRALVVVGDGGDNASSTTFDQVLNAAHASNAAIYSVGIVDPLEREANPRRLKRLAQATGGEAFFPGTVDDVDEVLRRIADDIRHSYTLGYVSSNPTRDSQFRRIRVTVTDSAGRSLQVRARDGYRAGAPLPTR